MAQRDYNVGPRAAQGVYSRVRLSDDSDYEVPNRKPMDEKPVKFRRADLHRRSSSVPRRPLPHELKDLYARSHDSNAVWESRIHFWWSLIHLVVTGGALAFSIIAALYAFGVDCPEDRCDFGIYITNTFLSTTRTGSLIGWPVATERASFDEMVQYPADKDSFAFSHYFECMWTAQMADSVCKNSTVLEYTTCLKATPVTSGALASCNALSTSLSQPWPSAEEYLRCLFGFSAMRNSVSVRASQNVFRSCLDKTMWPFFEVQQGVDTNLLLGSFNWLIMLAVSLICMTSFAVYTASPVEQGVVKEGEPSYYMRLGSLWATISTIWNVVFFTIFFTVAVRDGTLFDTNGGLATTQSTSVISLFMLAVCAFYFGSELLEAKDFEFGAHIFHYVSRRGDKAELVRHGHVVVENRGDDDEDDVEDNPSGPLLHNGLKLGSMPNPSTEKYSISAEEVAKFYTPPLINVWADGFIADPCFFLGMAGATGHVNTDQAWGIFFVVLMYRLLNMLISRFMYQCFMNNLSFTDAVNKSYDSIATNPQKAMGSNGHIDGMPHLNIQVMALSTQFASIILFAALCCITLDSNSQFSDFSLFRLCFIFCFIIPEALRIIVHVICQVRKPAPNRVPWNLLNFYFFVWTYDLALRVIFVMVVIWSVAKEPGSRTYLGETSIKLLDTYPAVLGVSLM